MSTRILMGGALVALLLGPLAPAAWAVDGEPGQSAGGARTAATGSTVAAGADKSAAAAPSGSDKAAKGKGKSEPDPGDFIPSEEISEDYAVSFPVDI